MRLLVSLAVAALCARAAESPYFAVLSEDVGAWPAILSSIGLEQRPAGISRIFVARAGASASPEWAGRIEKGAILILEGESSLADSFGFRRAVGKENVKVSSLTDVHRPELRIVWGTGLELPAFEVPEKAQVFARERWSGAPMEAGFRQGAGAVLWIAAPPGERGYERFPYLLQALIDLGLEPPLHSARLWAFFDSAYRSRVDLDYFAARWREAGISALHVAAWHFFEPDPERDQYLRKLIEASHRQGILVYAWLELPHVSEKFWGDHPEWREKTAILQDAQLDWRKLMNLSNRECFRAVAGGVKELGSRFDWDGFNLAELYFESLQGIDNPSRFTPMNDDVRREFRNAGGFDPIELFSTRKDAASKQAVPGLPGRTCGPHRAGVARGAGSDAAVKARSGCGADARRRPPRSRDARCDRGRCRGGAAVAQEPTLTFLIEDPATLMEPGSAAVRHHRGTVRRADGGARPVGDRHQCGGPVSGCVSDQAADRNGAFRVGPWCERKLFPGGVVLRKLAPAARFRTDSRCSRSRAGGRTRREDSRGVGVARGSPLEGAGGSRWRALACDGWAHGVAAGGASQRRAWRGARRAEAVEAERRAAIGQVGRRDRAGVQLPRYRPGDCGPGPGCETVGDRR